MIKGLAYGDNFLFYVVESGSSYQLYRYDILTRQSVSLGGLEAWTGINDIAYDPDNELLYAVGGFYMFQYNTATLQAAEQITCPDYLMVPITAQWSVLQ